MQTANPSDLTQQVLGGCRTRASRCLRVLQQSRTEAMDSTRTGFNGKATMPTTLQRNPFVHMFPDMFKGKLKTLAMDLPREVKR